MEHKGMSVIDIAQHKYTHTGRKVVIPEANNEGRKTGTTTRQIDAAIQHLFHDDIVICIDHHNSPLTNAMLYDRIIRRLIIEHSIATKYIISDKRDFTIYLKFT